MVLPAGADLITLVRVLHDHDDQPAMALLRAVRRALPRGGRVVLAEPMTGVRGAIPGTEAYFAFYLLAMGQGRARSAARGRADAGYGRLPPAAPACQCAALAIRGHEREHIMTGQRVASRPSVKFT